MHDGWNQETKTTDHAQAMRYAASLGPVEARFVAGDCREAARLQPENPKAGHYLDVAHYCDMRRAGTIKETA